MLHEVLAWSGLASLLIAVAIAIGSSFRSSRNVTSMANYRDAALSWETRANAQEAEIIDLRKQLEEFREQNARQQAELDMLRDLVTGRTEISQLHTQVERAFDMIGEKMIGREAFIKWQREVRQEITEVRTQLGTLVHLAERGVT